MKTRYYLFAWNSPDSKGGFNDLCGDFETPGWAFEFFKNSSHCQYMDTYQIIEVPSMLIFQEGERHS